MHYSAFFIFKLDFVISCMFGTKSLDSRILTFLFQRNKYKFKFTLDIRIMFCVLLFLIKESILKVVDRLQNITMLFLISS